MDTVERLIEAEAPIEVILDALIDAGASKRNVELLIIWFGHPTGTCPEPHGQYGCDACRLSNVRAIRRVASGGCPDIWP